MEFFSRNPNAAFAYLLSWSCVTRGFYKLPGSLLNTVWFFFPTQGELAKKAVVLLPWRVRSFRAGLARAGCHHCFKPCSSLLLRWVSAGRPQPRH